MYKRNQVEGAIEKAVYPGVRAPSLKAAQTLHIRLKRLTETDRELGVNRRAADNLSRLYAFFDTPPPGRGTEVTYSAYGSFALLLGVRLLDGGLPQTEVVTFMRRIRAALESAHQRILSKEPETLIDHKPLAKNEDEIQHGRIVQKFDNMQFLIVPGGSQGGHLSIELKTGSIVNIVRGTKALADTMAALATSTPAPIICMELVNAAHQLAFWLDCIEPIKRGRK